MRALLHFLRRALRFVRVRGNTAYYRIKYRLLGRRVVWGRDVRVSGKLIIEGPGLVEFGDGVYLNGSGSPVTPFTHAEGARLVIGARSFVNGTRFGCMSEITIGEGCVLASASIMDTDFHSVDPEARRRDEPGPVRPVRLGENVWIAGGVIVLKGTEIGRDSTVGAGSVVSGRFPERSLIAGNPARLVRRIPQRASVTEGGALAS